MYTILVIEDERKLLQTLADFLRLNKYEVLTAGDGLEGLRCFRQNEEKIDLVLLDLMLPFAGGLEVLKDIRLRSNVPVIVLSARETVEDQIQGFESGADDYITKPYSLAVVKAHVEAVLKRAAGLPDAGTLVSGALTLELLKNSRSV